MKGSDMDKHILFLHDYAVKHGIIFRVSKSSISIEEYQHPLKKMEITKK
jgi:hypothetical protein